MKTKRWKDIETALRNNTPGESMPGAEAFWEDFKARARLRGRETADEPVRPVFATRWAIAGACVALLLILVGVQTFHTSVPQEASHIDSLEVFASHSAVLIMEDEPSQSMIVWIVDMDADENNGENVL